VSEKRMCDLGESLRNMATWNAGELLRDLDINL